LEKPTGGAVFSGDNLGADVVEDRAAQFPQRYHQVSSYDIYKIIHSKDAVCRTIDLC